MVSVVSGVVGVVSECCEGEQTRDWLAGGSEGCRRVAGAAGTRHQQARTEQARTGTEQAGAATTAEGSLSLPRSDRYLGRGRKDANVRQRAVIVQARPDSSHGSVAGWLADGLLAASVVAGGGSAAAAGVRA